MGMTWTERRDFCPAGRRAISFTAAPGIYLLGETQPDPLLDQPRLEKTQGKTRNLGPASRNGGVEGLIRRSSTALDPNGLLQTLFGWGAMEGDRPQHFARAGELPDAAENKRKETPRLERARAFTIERRAVCSTGPPQGT